MEILGPSRAGAVSVGVGTMPELPAWHWCLGEGLAPRPAERPRIGVALGKRSASWNLGLCVPHCW